MNLRLLFLLLFSTISFALFAGNKRYTVQIDFPKAYISGVCIMHEEEEVTTASIMNEFGVSALSYRYDAKTGKIRIVNIIKQLDKWYIKRVLKKDLRAIMQSIPADDSLNYTNKKYNIIYHFTPLPDETA